MEKPTITETLATNLAHFMEAKNVTQKALAARASVGQTTISLYLHPDRRKESASGKENSPTLARIQALADALGIELWELLRPLTPTQRDLLRSVEALVAEHAAPAPTVVVSAPQVAPRRRRTKPSAKRIRAAA